MAFSQPLRQLNVRLDEQLPTHHRLSRVYRFGSGLTGVLLMVFGVLGLVDRVGFFSTGDSTVAGLSTNGALSVLSLAVGLLLVYGAARGGTFASTLDMALGTAFLLSGFVNLALLETGANLLNFRIQNVLFSFAVGLMLLIFGMYGRVGGHLSHTNPYWRARHPEQAAREDRRRAVSRRRRTELRPGSAPPH